MRHPLPRFHICVRQTRDAPDPGKTFGGLASRFL